MDPHKQWDGVTYGTLDAKENSETSMVVTSGPLAPPHQEHLNLQLKTMLQAHHVQRLS